jgi:hypothetical protein
MKSNIATINSNIPIKAIPEEKLNAVILGDFLDWVCGTLSLNEDGADKLKFALPAIKKHCWSMGFTEIKKMLEMYADGDLSVKPIPNHFDRIKLGEVANAYRAQKPRKKIERPPELSQEEKDAIVYTGVITCFDAYKQDGFIRSGYSYVYDLFYEKKKFPAHTKEFKDKLKIQATQELKSGIRAQGINLQVKDALNDLKTNEGALKVKCKEIVLRDYFDGLIEKGTNIKDELK